MARTGYPPESKRRVVDLGSWVRRGAACFSGLSQDQCEC